MPIRRSRWRSPAAPIAIAALALTACASPEPPPPPITSESPVFETEEQALAAVTGTYEEYLRLENTILAEGGVQVERIDRIIGTSLVEREHLSLGELAAAGKTIVGAPVLTTTAVSEWYRVPDAAGVVAIGRACTDLSGVQVYDAAGMSTVGADRPVTRTWSMKISPGGDGQSAFVIVELDAIAEGASCDE